MPGVTDTAPSLDTQQLELIGRSLLVGELLRDGLEVALPERDRGIDLIAYVEGDQTGVPFVARPIQMKARTAPAFTSPASTNASRACCLPTCGTWIGHGI
jgi:hypothetical protein